MIINKRFERPLGVLTLYESAVECYACSQRGLVGLREPRVPRNKRELFDLILYDPPTENRQSSDTTAPHDCIEGVDHSGF